MGEVLRPGLARTADEMIDAIRSAVPAYARPLDGAFGAGIRTGVVRALEQFVSAVEGARRRPPSARDIYFELGRGEAREGRALEALLVGLPRRGAGGVAQRRRQRPRRGPGGRRARPAGRVGVRVHRPALGPLGGGLCLRAVRDRGRGRRPPPRTGAADGVPPPGGCRRRGGGRTRGSLAASRDAGRRGVARTGRASRHRSAPARVGGGGAGRRHGVRPGPGRGRSGPAPGAGPRPGRCTRGRGPGRSLAGDLAERRAGRLRAAAGRGRSPPGRAPARHRSPPPAAGPAPGPAVAGRPGRPEPRATRGADPGLARSPAGDAPELARPPGPGRGRGRGPSRASPDRALPPRTAARGVRPRPGRPGREVRR